MSQERMSGSVQEVALTQEICQKEFSIKKGDAIWKAN